MRRTRTGCCHLGLCAAAALVLAPQGCVVKEWTTTSSRVVIPEGGTVELAERRSDLPDAPLITQTSMASTISIDPLGSVAYDGFTLPIMCPIAGKHLFAVQSGPRPSWEALLAQGAEGAQASGVSIYEYVPGKSPALITEHADGIILGRAANQEGVLVERPNLNGSRWIGLAPWDGGEIRWLQSDSSVNAFAWIDEDSTLVYAQRTVEEEYFELVVRRADGSTWRLEEPLPYSWILPVLDPSGGGLYALRLGHGFGDIAWGQLEDSNTFRQTLALHRVSDRVDLRRAWQILAATTGGAGLASDQLAWFSFELGRLVLWNPQLGTTDLLPTGTVAACAQDANREWLITTAQSLERLAILQTMKATTLLFNGPWIARPGADGTTIIVLADSDSLDLAALRTSPIETTTDLSNQGEDQGSSPPSSPNSS